MQSTHRIWLPFLVATFVLAGCGKSIRTGEVKGIVTLDDEPLARIGVLFTPDNAKNNYGPSSAAVTDEHGRFTLIYSTPNDANPAEPYTGKGAVLGWHVVTLVDQKMLDELLPPPARVAPMYSDPSMTPFRFEVFEKQQFFELRAQRK